MKFDILTGGIFEFNNGNDEQIMPHGSCGDCPSVCKSVGDGSRDDNCDNGADKVCKNVRDAVCCPDTGGYGREFCNIGSGRVCFDVCKNTSL